MMIPVVTLLQETAGPAKQEMFRSIAHAAFNALRYVPSNPGMMGLFDMANTLVGGRMDVLMSNL